MCSSTIHRKCFYQIWLYVITLLLSFTHLFVPLAVAEGTSVRKNERKKYFSFVFHSLIRTFGCRRRYFRSENRKKKGFFFCFSLTYSYLWLSPKVLPFGKSKEKRLFLLFFTHLFVPLQKLNESYEGTSLLLLTLDGTAPGCLRGEESI